MNAIDAALQDDLRRIYEGARGQFARGKDDGQRFGGTSLFLAKQARANNLVVHHLSPLGSLVTYNKDTKTYHLSTRPEARALFLAELAPGVGTNRQPHHAASIGQRDDMLAQEFFDATGIDIRTSALNLVQPPLSSAGQDALRRDGIAPSSHTAAGASDRA